MDLEQSPYLNVFPEQKVRQTLQVHGPVARTNASPRTWGREICLRNGIKAMLNGSIANLGSQYVITLGRREFNQWGIAGARRDAKPARKRMYSTRFIERDRTCAGKMGESLGSVQKFDKPLSEATTSSLDALKAFSLADMKHEIGDRTGGSSTL